MDLTPPSAENVWIALTELELPIAAAHVFLSDAAAGGVCVFVGTTRQWTKGRETKTLSYEAYEALATKELEALGAAAQRQWEVNRLVLWHRLGEVRIGEASVCIGVSAPHREAAFAAARYLIDTLKIQVPIWKREFYADGETTWVQGTDLPRID